jgi:hypothetical protein
VKTKVKNYFKKLLNSNYLIYYIISFIVNQENINDYSLFYLFFLFPGLYLLQNGRAVREVNLITYFTGFNPIE